MVFELFRSQAESSLDGIEEQISEMLDNCRSTLDLAGSAVLGDIDADEVGKSLRKTDRAVNRAERAIRRELLVHVSAHGTGADLPLVLVYMSIIKDIERIGDYAKNIWDIADAGSDPAVRPSEYRPLIERTRGVIDDVGDIFAQRDADRATELLRTCDAWLDDYDENIVTLMQSSAPSTVGVPQALLNRYLKRITAHLMNVLTAVVMPFDRLDYFDEDKIDRD